MIYLIPTSTTESCYEQTVTLDGASYRLRLAWAERERRWFLDLSTVDGVPILQGKKIVADRPLTQRLTCSSRPAGELWCIDTTGAGVDPDLRDLGARCLLLYVDGVSSV